MKCRLLYLVGQLAPGGAERELYNLLQVMDRELYKPAIVVWNFSEDDVFVSRFHALGIPLYSLPSNVSSALKLIAFRRLVKKLKPEVVHSFTFFTNFIAYWGANGICPVHIGSIQSDFIRDKKKNGSLVGRLSARWPRIQICNSIMGAENVKRSISLFVPKYTHVVRNGVDLNRFPMSPVPNHGKIRIIGVGSLLPVKRWDRLITASATLKQRGLDFSLDIVGEGPLRQPLEQQVRDLGLSDRVKLIGYAEDIPQLMSCATFLTHTSEIEGNPNVIAEAMACGRAVVAMEAGDIPYLVDDDKTGFVVPNGNREKLVERMTTLIRDPNLCRRMGEAARAKAEREFTLERVVTEHLSVYRHAGWDAK
jgi:glycosyltransferase involved in cell wall biosynthesis